MPAMSTVEQPRSHVIAGQLVTMPVRVREASSCAAMFAVPGAAAREVMGYSGLRLFQPMRGKAICSLAFVRYVDGDLGQYHEFAVAFLVRAPGRRCVGAFVHWLPVDQAFTLEAGRTIWGFPKEMAEIDLDTEGRLQHCVVRQEGRLVVDLRIRTGPSLPIPRMGSGDLLQTYTCMDGVVRRTPWHMQAQQVRSRPAGAAVRLGDHPVADELRALGFPRRALLSTAVGHAQLTFADAELLGRP